MVSRSQKIRLGLFILTACSIILITVGALSFNRLFSPKDIYYIKYSNQSLRGIDIGSQVKYLGIPIGTVRDLRINPGNYNEIIVTVAIEPDTPIRKDVKSNLATMGITGIKLIELTAGSPDVKKLEPGSYIQPGKSVTDEFVEQAETITYKIEQVLDNILEFTENDARQRVLSFIDEAHGTIVTRNQRKVDETIDELNATVRYLNNTARMVNSDPSILIRGVRPNNPPDNRLREN